MAGLTTNTGAHMEESVIEAFVSTIRGDVIRPDDDTYDEARRIRVSWSIRRPGSSDRFLLGGELSWDRPEPDSIRHGVWALEPERRAEETATSSGRVADPAQDGTDRA